MRTTLIHVRASTTVFVLLSLVARRVLLFTTPWAVARQAPLSMGILWARILECVPCPPPGDPPNSGIEPRSPALQADSLLSQSSGKPFGEGLTSLKAYV